MGASKVHPLSLQGIHNFLEHLQRSLCHSLRNTGFGCLLLELYPQVQQRALCAVNFQWCTEKLWDARRLQRKFRFETLALGGLRSLLQLHISYIFYFSVLLFYSNILSPECGVWIQSLLFSFGKDGQYLKFLLLPPTLLSRLVGEPSLILELKQTVGRKKTSVRKYLWKQISYMHIPLLLVR